MSASKSGRFASTFEDTLRAAGYFVIMVWAVLFAIYPPTAFTGALEDFTRLFWMAVTFLGAATAFAGAVTGIDIKIELPGLLVTQLGPLFYFISQLYYVSFPEGVDQTGRIALVAYAILPGVLLLPRTHRLYKVSRSLKRINTKAGL